MTTKWKNNVFSNQANNPETPNISQTSDIYKDYNYKQIPPLNNVLVEDVESDDEDVEPFQEGIIDTSALDEDDVSDVIDKNRNQTVIETTTPPAAKKKSKSKISDDVKQSIDEIKQIFKKIEIRAKSMNGKNFRIEKMYELLSMIIGFPAKLLDKSIDLFGALYVDLVNKMQADAKLSTKEKPYRDLLSVGRTQIKSVISIIVSFWIVLNWWYIFNYHHSFFSIAKMVDATLLRIPFESVMMFTNVVNYLLIGLKQDTRVPFMEKVNAFLWSWRPIVFVLFFIIIQSIYSKEGSKIENMFTQAMARKSNPISGLNTFFFIMSFVEMDIVDKDRMFDRKKIFGFILIVFFIILLKLLFIMALLPFGVMFVYLFLVFHSFFALPVFAGSSFFTAIGALFTDLKNSVPDADPTVHESSFSKVMRYVLNMGVPIGMVITVVSVLINNISIVYKVAGGNSLKIAMGTISIIVMAIVLFFGAVYIYASRPVTYPT